MKRAGVIIVGALVLAAAWTETERAPVTESPVRFVGDRTDWREAIPSGTRHAGVENPRPGFPTMPAETEDRSWRAMVWRELRDPAEQLGADRWEAQEKEQFLVALTSLRDAGRRRERFATDPDGESSIDAAQRHRSAAIEADARSREMFGMPLGEFLRRAEPGSIEEVPTG
ncbi:MAG: hypothetical protein P8R42_24330 [Candidatus Binatia bacterium]|nr:hypothetical protein [Candidatus Binatia bacterium]